MTKHLLLLLTATLLLTFHGAAQGQKKPAAITNIRSVNFLNYSHKGGICSSELGMTETVKVKRGKYQDRENYFQVLDNKIVYGDLNGDRREEAIVHIKCGGRAGNFSYSEIAIYTLKRGKAELLTAINTSAIEDDHKRFSPDGFIVSVSSAKVLRGMLVIEAYADGSNAGPTHIATFNYKISSDGATLNGKPRIRPSRLR